MIVGAYALAYHGAPRFSGDIDIFVKPSLNNAQRILSALSAFGSLNLTIDDFQNPDSVVQLGVPLTGRESSGLPTCRKRKKAWA